MQNIKWSPSASHTPGSHPFAVTPMTVEELKILFPKNMRWARRCQSLQLNFCFGLAHSTNIICFTTLWRAGGTMVRDFRILIFNAPCLYNSSFESLQTVRSSSLSPHPHLLPLQNLLLRNCPRPLGSFS